MTGFSTRLEYCALHVCVLLFYLGKGRGASLESRWSKQTLSSELAGGKSLTLPEEVLRTSLPAQQETIMFPVVWVGILDAGLHPYNYNVSSDCRDSLVDYSQGFLRRELWAVRMFDSCGKPSPGMLMGGLTQFGNYDECLNLNNYPELQHNGTAHYCSVYFAIPDWMSNFFTSLDVPYPVKLRRVTVDLCVPHTCTTSDLFSLVSQYVTREQSNVTLEGGVNCFQQEAIGDDAYAIVVILLFSLILLLVLIGTCVDLVERLSEPEAVSGPESAVGFRPTRRRTSRLSRLGSSFYRHWKRIGSRGSGDLQWSDEKTKDSMGRKPSLIRRISNSMVGRTSSLIYDADCSADTSQNCTVDEQVISRILSMKGSRSHETSFSREGGESISQETSSREDKSFLRSLSQEERGGLKSPESLLKSSREDNIHLRSLSSKKGCGRKSHGVASTEQNGACLMVMRQLSDDGELTGNFVSPEHVKQQRSKGKAKPSESIQKVTSNSQFTDLHQDIGTLPSTPSHLHSHRSGEVYEKAGMDCSSLSGGADIEVCSLCDIVLGQDSTDPGGGKADDSVIEDGVNTGTDNTGGTIFTSSARAEDNTISAGQTECKISDCISATKAGNVTKITIRNKQTREPNTNGSERHSTSEHRCMTKVKNSTESDKGNDVKGSKHTETSGRETPMANDSVSRPQTDGYKYKPEIIHDHVHPNSFSQGPHPTCELSPHATTKEHPFPMENNSCGNEHAPSKSAASSGHPVPGTTPATDSPLLQPLGLDSPLSQTNEQAALSCPTQGRCPSPIPHQDVNSPPSTPASCDKGVTQYQSSTTEPGIGVVSNLSEKPSHLNIEATLERSQTSTPYQSPTMEEASYGMIEPAFSVSENHLEPENPVMGVPGKGLLLTIPEETVDGQSDTPTLLHYEKSGFRRSRSLGTRSLGTHHNNNNDSKEDVNTMQEEESPEIRLRRHADRSYSEMSDQDTSVTWRDLEDGTNMRVKKDKPEHPEQSLLVQVLLCFSFVRSVRKVVAEGSADHLFSLNGVRVLSAWWIVLSNTLSMMHGHPDLIVANRVDTAKMAQTFWFQAVMNGTFAADSFFILSGCLVCYNFLRGKSKQLEEKPSVPVLTVKTVLLFYFHRLMRIVPCFYVALWTYTVLLPYLGSGPRWVSSTDRVLRPCRQHWWANALFFSNFYQATDMCMSWSYYLVNDIQMYLLSPVVLYPLLLMPWLGLLLVAVLVILQIVTTVILTPDNNGNLLSMGSEFFGTVYAKPYCRVAAYSIGIGLGYFLHSTRRLIFFRKTPLLLGWMTSLVVVGMVVYISAGDTGKGAAEERWSRLQYALYQALSRPAWCMAVAFIIFVCSIGQGGFVNAILSWNAFMPLCRITYGVYLLHPILINSVLNSSRYPQYLSFTSLVYMFVSNLTCSYALAFLLITLVESPFTSLEAVLRTHFC